MKKIWEFLAKNNRWAILLIILLIVIGGGIYKLQSNKISNLNIKYDSEVKLKNALLDTVHTYKNKEGQWVTEKLTIQERVEDLLEDSARLTKSQKKLVDKINDVNKENSIITAALIHSNFIVDSLKHGGVVDVDTANKTVNFTELINPDIRYDFLASGVLPFPINSKPTLFINNLTLPNEQFVEFHWNDDKKADFPIAFSVTNTNKYVKVYDVNSYAIPAIQKDVLNPTGWEKFGAWMNRNQKYLKWFGGGALAGGAATYIILK